MATLRLDLTQREPQDGHQYGFREFSGRLGHRECIGRSRTDAGGPSSEVLRTANPALVINVNDWATDKLRKEVAALILVMLSRPGQPEVITITGPHREAMEEIGEYIQSQGHMPDKEVFQRLVRNAVHDLVSREHEVLGLIDRGSAYNSSVTERERQWCIGKGLAEKPRWLIKDAEFVGEGHNHDLSTMRPAFFLTDRGRERQDWLWELIRTL